MPISISAYDCMFVNAHSKIVIVLRANYQLAIIFCCIIANNKDKLGGYHVNRSKQG